MPMVEHLYVHIPFCPKICPYCSFYKEVGGREKTGPFLEAVLAEAGRHAAILRPRTVFFGGGTPTALSTRQLESLIVGLRERVDFSNVVEFTVEMNPATVSAEKAAALRDLGVNRVSMGVQSWDDAILKTLGRVHTADQARRSFRILRESGIASLNVDLMFGVPGQSLACWVASLDQTVALGPDHISAYCLTYEEDTEYFRRLGAGLYSQDPAEDARFFEVTMATLAAGGFAQYEISNYARPGRECLHNLAYWQGRDNLGLGPSAFSTVGNQRWKNVSDTTAYTRRILAGNAAEDFAEDLDQNTRRAEQVAFGLRTTDGIDAAWAEPNTLAPLVAAGLVTRNARRVVLTETGKLVADAVAAELI
jgi:oxygen-independent coproporphyrinogen-3 oxidase